MTKIITCSKLRYPILAELEALFQTLQIELGRTAPGSPRADEAEAQQWRSSSSHMTRCWRRQSRANSSLETPISNVRKNERAGVQNRSKISSLLRFNDY
jgi:ferric-dicitrate binding protein FerR (iron transport regulator)